MAASARETKAPGARFPKAARLLSRADFDRASRGASQVVTPHFKVIRGRGTAGRPRLGLIVPRKIGGAVARNRVKRLIREWFREAQTGLPQTLELIVIARSGAPQLDFADVARELHRAVRRAEGRPEKP